MALWRYRSLDVYKRQVLYGLVLSTVLGFIMGWITVKITELICRGINRRKTTGFFQDVYKRQVIPYVLLIEKDSAKL